jgi:HK97 family phage portal protein
MPAWLSNILTRSAEKDLLPVNRLEGFNDNGVILRDRRGTLKQEMPEVTEKSIAFGSDPLAIYRPTNTKNVNAARAMANFSGWVFASVNAIASEVANIQIRLYKLSGDEHQEVVEHELLTLLEGVNETMTGIELKYTMMAHLELAGNAYILMDGVKSDTDKPKALYPLNPGSMHVRLDKSRFPYRISHYEYHVDGNIITFQPYQILHLKYPDPNDPFVGIGVPQTIPSWIDSDNYAMEYNRKFFQNGASIGLFIQTDTNVEGNIDRIRKGFDNRYSGVDNAHKVPVLPKGVKLEHSGVTQRDMDFSTLTEATRDRILAGFRVSKTILGTAESDTNRSTAETADYVFSKRTIKPKMLLVISYLNEFLAPRYGDDLYLTFIDPVPEDKQFRTQEMTAASGGVPLMTQNEARAAYLGLGPIEGGDKLLKPAAMDESGISATPEGENPTPQLAKSRTAEGWLTSGIRIRTGGKTSYSASKNMRDALSGAFKKRIDAAPEYQMKKLSELTHAEYMEHYKRFNARTEHALEDLRNMFMGINGKQKEEVLENLPEVTGITKALADIFDLQKWITITIDLATPILTALTKDEAAAALTMIGAKPTDILADEGIANALDVGIAKMARSYNETTLQQLKDKLKEKLNQDGGTNLTELTQTVDDVFNFADEKRAGVIAKTESFRAANFANKAAWQQSGVVKTVKWFTAEDANVCQYCAQQDGKEIDINENFFDAGDTIGGKDGGVMTADYGDIGGPPLHPSCRCYIRPEVISTD